MLLAQQALRHGGAPRKVDSRVRHFGEVGAPPVEIHLVTELLSCVSSALPTAVPTLFHAVLQANTALRDGTTAAGMVLAQIFSACGAL